MLKHTLAAALLIVATATAVQAQEIYTQVGIPGVGIGYAQGINENFTVRADINTLGRWHHDGSFKESFPYAGTLRFNQVGTYVDWFPFGNGWRLTGGLNIRQARLKAEDRFVDGNTGTIGGITIGEWRPKYLASATIKLPTVAPYIGIGYGHNVATQKAGFTFLADIGVAYSRPKASVTVNQELMDALNAVSSGQAQRALDRELSKVQADVDKYKFMPQIFIGIGYRF